MPFKHYNPSHWNGLKVPGPRFELGIGQYQSSVIAIASECHEKTVLHEMYYILESNNLRFCKVFGSICSTTEEGTPWRLEVCIPEKDISKKSIIIEANHKN